MTTLTEDQKRRAAGVNQERLFEHSHRDAYIRAVRSRVGLAEAGALDGDFAQALANWQEQHPASVLHRHFNGQINALTEAHLGIALEEMERVAREAERRWRLGNVFYDSWTNDQRDNDLDGAIDEDDERSTDGAHYRNTYRTFGVPEGSRQARDQDFQYRFCSDFVTEVLLEAQIIRGGYARAYDYDAGALRAVAHKFDREDGYPERYMRGDIIGYNDPGGHGGHVGIIVRDDATNGGSAAPFVINLPGPTYLTSREAEGYYRPNGEHKDGRPDGVRGDIVREDWPQSRLALPPNKQFLIRLVCTKLHRLRVMPRLPRDNPRGPGSGS